MHTLMKRCRGTLALAAAMAVPVMIGAAPAAAASWHIIASPNSSGNDSLGAVTSFSPSNVWAVGQAYSLSSTSATLIERYNGSSWQIVPSPNAAGGRYNSLNAVAGTSASDIWSVGYDLSSRAHTHPLTEHYNGSAWSVVPAPQVAQMDGLAGVAPVSPGDAWAVGGGNTGTGITPPLVEHYDGSAWSVVATPLTTPGWLNAVTAISASNVWAVGNIPGRGASTHTGLVMHYDGKGWAQVAVPAPTPSTDWELSAVSATSASDVWAAGYASNGSSAQHAIVEHFNGTSWSVTEAPDPAGSPLNGFTGVAAVSPANVWAIGSSSPGNGTSTPLVEHFDGSSWTVQPAPAKAGSTISLSAITGTSAGQLWAVGGSSAAGSTNSQTLTALLS
jgi:hypothetical protein